jgi:hypothetical protein
VKQITFGLGVSDVEPCWLPSGEIVFNSSRASSHRLLETSVSNLYTCDSERRFLRRLCYGPSAYELPADARRRRVFTRAGVQRPRADLSAALFVMNGDGTGHPSFTAAARGIRRRFFTRAAFPGTQKVTALRRATT